MKQVCDNCEELDELLYCIECSINICQQCIQQIHQRGKFKKHIQVPITQNNSQLNDNLEIENDISLMSPQKKNYSKQENQEKFSFGKNSDQIFKVDQEIDKKKQNFDLILKTQQNQEQSIFETNEKNLKIFTQCGQTVQSINGGRRLEITQEQVRKSLNECLVRQLNKCDLYSNAVVYDFYEDFQFDYMNIKNLLTLVKEEKKLFKFYFLIALNNNLKDIEFMQNMFKQEFNFHKKSVTFLLHQSEEQKIQRLKQLVSDLKQTQLIFLISHDPLILCEQIHQQKRKVELKKELSVVIIQRHEESSREIQNILYIQTQEEQIVDTKSQPIDNKSEISAFTFGPFTPKLNCNKKKFNFGIETILEHEYNVQSVQLPQSKNSEMNKELSNNSEHKTSSHKQTLCKQKQQNTITQFDQDMQFPIHFDKEDSEDTLKIKRNISNSLLTISDKQDTSHKKQSNYNNSSQQNEFKLSQQEQQISKCLQEYEDKKSMQEYEEKKSFYQNVQLDLSDMMDGQTKELNKSDMLGQQKELNKSDCQQQTIIKKGNQKNILESRSNNDLQGKGLDKQEFNMLLDNYSYVSSSLVDLKGQKDQVILDNHQKFLDIHLQESLQTSYQLQNYLMWEAENGQAFILEQELEQRFNQWAQTHCKNHQNIVDVSILLEEAVCKKVVQLVIRQFGNSAEYRFIGLRLRSISYQALVWVLRSLRTDKMSGSHKNIINRFKEAFNYKLEHNHWLQILGRVQEQQFQVVINRFGLPSIVIEQASQQVQLESEQYVGEDQGTLQLADQKLWDAFLSFVDQFFDMTRGGQQCSLAEKRKWSSSIKNSQCKGEECNKNEYKNKKNQSLPPKSLDKAIPGGKYGCAQLLKFCGPPVLSQQSLGKLNLVVQEAITRKVLVYFKTLLVKNNNVQKESRQLEHTVDSQQESNILDSYVKQRVQAVQSLVLQLLEEHKQGIALSKLPKYIQPRLHFTFDLHELGFAKLKGFLETMQGQVRILHQQSSQAVVQLISQQIPHITRNNNSNNLNINTNHINNNNNNQLQHDLDNSSQINKSWNGIQELQSTPKDIKHKITFNSSRKSSQKVNSMWQKNDKIFNKQIENNYMLKINQILKENKNMISVAGLEEQLETLLGQPVNFDQLGYRDLCDFLDKKFKHLQSTVDQQGQTCIKLEQHYQQQQQYTPEQKIIFNQQKYYNSCPQKHSQTSLFYNQINNNNNICFPSAKVLFPETHNEDNEIQLHEKSIIQNLLDENYDEYKKQQQIDKQVNQQNESKKKINKKMSIQSRPMFQPEFNLPNNNQ